MSHGRVLGLAAAAGIVLTLPRPTLRTPPAELVNADGASFDRFEASGIGMYAGRLLVVDDTLNEVFVFSREGRLEESLLPDGFPSRRAKFEDLAVDPGTGEAFAVGSHEGYTQANLEDFSQLIRFRLAPRGAGIAVEPGSVLSLPLRRGFQALGLWRPRAMKIEGLAFDGERRELYVGLREPAEPARVYRVSLDALERAAGDERESVPLIEALRFEAGAAEGTPFHLSALTWLPERRALLMVTSTEDETTHRFEGNRIWLGVPDEGRVRLLLDTFDRGLKAEGVVVDGAADPDVVYVCYDDDQDDTGVPSRLRTLSLRELIFPDSPDREGPARDARR